jgi:hypothetical protein
MPDATLALRDRLGDLAESLSLWFNESILLVSLMAALPAIVFCIWRLHRKKVEVATWQATCLVGALAGFLFSSALLLPLAARSLWTPETNVALSLPSCVQKAGSACVTESAQASGTYLKRSTRNAIKVTPTLLYTILTGFLVSLLGLVVAAKEVWKPD